jgi:hypothetical protein
MPEKPVPEEVKIDEEAPEDQVVEVDEEQKEEVKEFLA